MVECGWPLQSGGEPGQEFIEHGWQHPHEVHERAWILSAQLYHQLVIEPQLKCSLNPALHPHSTLVSSSLPSSPLGQLLLELQNLQIML